MATMMAADDKDNEVDGDGATGDGVDDDDGATGDGATMMTMAMGDDDDDDDGDGATGNEVDNDGDGTMGDGRRREINEDLHDCMQTYYETEKGKGDNVKVFDKGDDYQSKEEYVRFSISTNCNVMVIHICPCSAFVQIASQQINLQAILLAHPPKR